MNEAKLVPEGAEMRRKSYGFESTRAFCGVIQARTVSNSGQQYKEI